MFAVTQEWIPWSCNWNFTWIVEDLWQSKVCTTSVRFHCYIRFNFRAMILFVIPEREFNIGDQMLIEQGLLSRCDHPSLLIKHVTLIEISRCCSLNSKGILFLWASTSFDQGKIEFCSSFSREFEVALVYYRTAYDPKHFYNEDVRHCLLMKIIKCMF